VHQVEFSELYSWFPLVILYIVVYKCQLQSPNSSHSSLPHKFVLYICVSIFALQTFRDVVLDLPLGPLLLSVRPWCCRSADVRDAAEASARESHLRHRRQHRISGFRDWSDDH